MLKFFIWTIVSGYGIITLVYLIRLYLFARGFVKAKKLGKVDNFSKELIFILPMYKEQKMAKETFDFFLRVAKSRPNTKAIFVTTAKETSATTKTTHEILSDCINESNQDFVRLYMYPKTEGVMAHQVNYAIKTYHEETNNDNTWVAIYNCDSRLSEIALNEIYYSVENANNNTVFQQYSYYHIPGKKGRSIPLSSAVWQTRWSIFKENATARNRNKIINKNIKNKNLQAILEPMAYCIGHGCISNINTFLSCGGMPEDTINEDTFMGYVFNCENKNLVPLYCLEKAESVPSTKALIAQQTSWYNGPVDSLNYYKLYNTGTTADIKRPICKKENKFRAKVLAYKSFDYAIHWICSPIIMLVILPIISCIAYGWWGILITFATAEIYLYFIHLLMYYYLKSQDIHIPFPSAIFDICFYACHGFSAINWVLKKLRNKHNMKDKYKTER